MDTNGVRAAIYLRVSREDQGISGAKGRDQRPAFDAMLKDAVRRRYDILMVWSIDRLGRSVLHVANALAELAAVRSVPWPQLSSCLWADRHDVLFQLGKIN